MHQNNYNIVSACNIGIFWILQVKYHFVTPTKILHTLARKSFVIFFANGHNNNSSELCSGYLLKNMGLFTHNFGKIMFALFEKSQCITLVIDYIREVQQKQPTYGSMSQLPFEGGGILPVASSLDFDLCIISVILNWFASPK